MIKKIPIFLIFVVSITPLAFAAPTSISMDPKNATYTYGEFVNFDLTTDEIGKNATLYIGDTFGIKTKVTDEFPVYTDKLHFIFPQSIQRDIYQVGKYFIFIEYEGLNDSIEFNIVDSDNVVISMPDRSFMIATAVTDDENTFFMKLLTYFENKDYLHISDIVKLNLVEKIEYPEYIKQTTIWWIEGKISDNDFVQFLQYIVEKNIIRFYENEQT